MIDVTTYNFNGNVSEKETATLLHNMGLVCVDLNWKMKDENKIDIGEVDGVFCDDINELYIIYDDSIKSEKRQDKISKFLNKWKDVTNKDKLREDLKLNDYTIYTIYIDKSENKTKLDSIKYILDDYTKIIYIDDYQYFNKIVQTVGKWAKNDFYNFLEIKLKKIRKVSINATQIYVGDTPAFVFADRVVNILNYSFISRRINNSNGYQRLVDKKRVDKMAKLIKSNKINAFPNSILLNCEDGISFVPKLKSECPYTVEIDLPSNFSSCKVVDGQHPLLAFSTLESRIQYLHSLPIVLFNKMPLEEEIKTFIDINVSQKGIDPNLIYSLKADLNFQAGTKENNEKIAVLIAKELVGSVRLFQGNVFFGDAGEERKKKITLTTIVQSMINFKIVDSNNGFLQLYEGDIETPYSKIKDFVNILLSKDLSSIDFYSSNNGIQLILKFTAILNRNIEKKYINVTIDIAIDELIKSINKNQTSLPSKYGKGGFNKIYEIIKNDIKNNSDSLTKIEFEIKKLK